MDAAGVVQATAKHPSNMSDSGSQCGTEAGGGHRRRHGSGSLLPALLLSSVFIVDASADDQSVMPIDAPKADTALIRPLAPFVPVPAASSVAALYRVDDLSENRSFSPRDFRPRGRSIFEDESSPTVYQDAPMLHGTTVWQRLAEYRSHGRVRLLTLWETGGTSVSLQAGRKGEPSLQWTSHLMNRGGASRGVLDHLFAVSIAGASRSMHLSPHAAPTSEGATKSAKATDVGIK